MPTALCVGVETGEIITLDNRERVRLEGVKTPPLGDLRFRRAKKALEELLVTQRYQQKRGGMLTGGGATTYSEVRYEGNDRDEQGNLICQVWVGDENINEAMKAQGYL